MQPSRNALRTNSHPPDVLDDQIGTFGAEPDNGDEEERDDVEVDHEPINYRAAQEAMYAGPTDFSFTSRSYDDEDAPLQAALKASMDDLPPGWVPPEVKDAPKPAKRSATIAAPDIAPAPSQPPPIETQQSNGSKSTTTVSPGAGGSKFKEEIEEDNDDAPAETLSPDEIRRRRLARFGGS